MIPTTLAILLSITLPMLASTGFSQSVTLDENQASFFDLVITVVSIIIPALLVVGVVLCTYALLRRNRSNLPRLFRRHESTEDNQNLNDRMPLMTPRANVNRSEIKPAEEVIPLETETHSITLEGAALNALEQALRLRDEGNIPQYYESIAMTTKRYISEKYQIKIGDTGQILAGLPHDLTDSVADHVGEILRTCDMVQFARHRPSRSDLNRIHQTAKEFFESQDAVSPAKDESHDD
ncbi:MAG: hypothetical protein OXP71_16485 [Candidatus Poribacteria bacterium]|nr:hypothetical protein [Candidatus Poribacteria bacterium]